MRSNSMTETAGALTDYPIKGLGPIVPTDPLVYRFYEIMQVYGLPLKAVIQEKVRRRHHERD